jgi:hypothetical protein
MKITKSRLRQIIKEELANLSEVEFGGEEVPTSGDIKFGYEQAYKKRDRDDLIDGWKEALKIAYGNTSMLKSVDEMSDEEIMQNWRKTEELISNLEDDSPEPPRKPDFDPETIPEPGEEFPKQRGMGRGLREKLNKKQKERKKKLEKELKDLEHQ